MQKHFLTINEVAELLGISTKTLRRWEAKGLISPHRTIGNQRRYSFEHVDRLKSRKLHTRTVSSQLPKSSFLKNDAENKNNLQDLALNQQLTQVVEEIELSQNTTGYKFLKIIILSAVFVFLLLSLAVAGLGGISPKNLKSSKEKVTKFISLLPEQIASPGNEIVKTFDQDVLQAATVKPDFALKINVPTEILNTASVSGNLTAPNILYGITAGQNITISGDLQNPTISATSSGVNSLDGKTGDLTLVAGSGISISNLTISNSDGGSAQKIFKNIKVGSSTITAGNNTDTLELVAGTGITLAANTSDKKVTITSSSTFSGLTTNGVLYADSATSLASLTPGTSGYILQSNGSGSPPSWIANSAGSLAFSALTDGTNTQAAMVVGSGASLTYSGGTATSGVINANQLLGGTWAIPGSIGATTPNAGAFTTLSGSSTITFSSFTSNGGILYTNGSGTVAQVTAGTSTQVLHGGTSPSFSAVSLTADVSGILPIANGGSPFEQNGSGAITERITTQDLLLGGIATSSSKFAFTGVAGSSTPVASIAATPSSGTSQGLSLNGDGTIQALNMNTLTLGGSSTGNIVIDSGSSLITLSDPTSLSSTLTVSGNLNANGNTTLGDAITDNITFTGRVAQDNDLIPITTTGTNDLGSSSLPWDNLYVGAVTQNGTTLDNTYAPINANFVTVTANATLTGETGIDALTTAISTTSTLNVDSSSTLNAVTLDANANLILSAGTGKIGLGTASPLAALDVRGNSGTTPAATISANTSFASLIVDNTQGDLFTASSSGVTQFVIRNGGNVGIGNVPLPTAMLDVAGTASVSSSLTFRTGTSSIQTTANNTLTIGGDTTGNITISPLNGSGITTNTGTFNLSSGKTYQINGTDVLSSTTLGTGVTTSSLTTVGALASGSIASGFGTIATSNTITGTTLNGTTGINTGAGAGTQRIDSSGNLTSIGTTQFNTITYTWPSSGQSSGYFLTTNGSGTLSWTDVANSTSTYWRQNSGALYPANSTVDLLLGGTATTSAKFTFTGVNGTNTPVASIAATPSSGTTQGLSLGGNGTIQSLNMNTLTIGGSSTGNIVIDSGSSTVNLADATASRFVLTNASKDLVFSGLSSILSDTLTDETGTGGVAVFNTSPAITTSLTTGSSSFDLIDTTATTVNFARAATTLTIGGTTGTIALRNPTLELGGTGASTIQTNSNDDLTITPNGTGNLILTGDFDTQVLIGATGATTEFPLLVRSGIGNNAALAIDNLNSGDLITASASGTTRFTVDTTGNILFGGGQTALSTLAKTGSTARTFTFPDITGTVCISGDVCASSGAVGYWQRTLGSLAPTNITDDLLLGATSTTSARFAFINAVGPGTPVASISAGTAGGSYLNATGTLATTAKQTLTLGDSNTGEISIGADATARRIFLGNATGATALNIDTGTGGINFGDNANTKTIDIGGVTNSGTDTINIATEGTAADVIAIGNSNASTTLALTGGDDWSVAATGVLTLSASSAQTTAIVATDSDYTNALSLADNNITGTAYSILATAGDLTLDASGDVILDADGADVFLKDNNTTFATFTNSSTDLTLDVAGGDLIFADGDVFSVGQTSYTDVAYNVIGDSVTGASANMNSDDDLYIEGVLEVDGTLYADGGIDSNLTANSVVFAGTNGVLSENTSNFIWDNTNLRLGLGVSTNLLGTLDARATLGTAPTATISGNTSFASLIVDNTQGDLFTASSSGVTQFVIRNGGAVGIGTNLPSARLEVAGTSTDNGLLLSRGGTSNSLSLFVNNSNFPMIQSAGSLLVNFGNSNSVQFGGSSAVGGANLALTSFGTVTFNRNSDSATAFRMLNADGKVLLNGATTGTAPVASIGAQTSFAGLVADNMIGDLFTASSSGLNRFVIKQNGDVGINTTIPAATLDVNTIAGSSNAETFTNFTLSDASGAYMRFNNGSSTDGVFIPRFESQATSTNQSMYLYANGVTGSDTGSNPLFYLNAAINGSAVSTRPLLQLVNAGTVKAHFAASGSVGINNSSPLGTFDIRPNTTNGGTIAVASVSGSTSFASLIADNSGAGDVFTASTSGRSLFTITQNRTQIGTGSAGAYNPQFLALDTKINAGDPSGGAEGYMYYNTSSNKFRCYQDTAWADCGGPAAAEYLRAEQQDDNTAADSEVDLDDHIKFNVVQGSSGSSISLDTSSAYVEGGSGASIGRFTLAANKTYRLSGSIAYMDGTAAGYVTFAWYDVTGGAQLGSSGGLGSDSNDGAHDAQGSDAEAVFTPTTSSRVELRLVALSNLSLIGLATATRYSRAYIEVLSDGTSVPEFTGATSTTDGALGYIPAPVAGQQGSLLLGNGDWTARTNLFIGINGTEPIASLSAKTSFAGLLVDNTGVGDLFTASSSGLNRFLIKQNGNVHIGTQSAVTSTWKLYVSDYNPATASAMIENTAGLKANGATGGCSATINCETGLIIKMGTPGINETPGSRDRWIHFMNGIGTTLGKIRGNGSLTTGIVYDTAGGDYGEWFKKANPSEEFALGDVVCQTENGGVTKCSNENNKIIGAISDNSGFVGNSSHEEDPNYVLVGLLGHITVNVSTQNGIINPGDIISVSTNGTGVAGKATKAGMVLGRAIDGYSNPDPNSIGKLIVYVSPTWHDPDIYLTSSGNINIFDKGTDVETGNTLFAVKDENDQELSRVGVFSDLAAANLRSGGINTEKLILAGQDVNDDISNLKSQISNLDSRVASIEAVLSLTSLTPPTPLTASSSAELSLDSLDVGSATVSGTLSVLGRTLLNDVGITGRVNIGLLSIDGLSNGNATINSIGTLKLQNQLAGGIDILDGKVTIDTEGNITTLTSLTAQTVNTTKLNIVEDPTSTESATLSTSAGSVIIEAGQTTIDVDTTALTPNSLIFVTPDQPVVVGAKKKDTDTFTIKLQTNSSQDIKINWWVVN